MKKVITKKETLRESVVSLSVKPETKEKVREVAKREGRLMSVTVDLMADFYMANKK